MRCIADEIDTTSHISIADGHVSNGNVGHLLKLNRCHITVVDNHHCASVHARCGLESNGIVTIQPRILVIEIEARICASIHIDGDGTAKAAAIETLLHVSHCWEISTGSTQSISSRQGTVATITVIFDSIICTAVQGRNPITRYQPHLDIVGVAQGDMVTHHDGIGIVQTQVTSPSGTRLHHTIDTPTESCGCHVVRIGIRSKTFITE